MKKTLADLKGDASPAVKNALISDYAKANLKQETIEKMEQVEYVTEEQASKVDSEAIMKEIEIEGPEKVVKMPIGMKIDEIDA